MTSSEDRKSGGRATGRGGSKSTASKPRSAQAQARAAKKAVTIDLEAKDLTPKQEAKSAVPKTRATTKTTSAKSATVSATAKSTAAGTSAKAEPIKGSEAAKSETAQAKPASAASSSKEMPNNSAAKNASVEPTPPSKPPAHKAGKSGSSFFPNIVASIIGGVIAVCGMIGLQKAEIIPSFGDGGVAALTSRVTNLEEVPAVNAVSLGEFASLSERLDEMERGIENIDKSTVPDEVLARLTALEARLSGAEEGTAPAITGNASLSNGIAERLAAIEARLSANESDDVDGQIAVLDDKLTKLDEGFAAVQSALKVEDGNNQSTVDVSAGSNDTNDASNEAASADLKSQLAALQEKVAALEIPLEGQGDSEAIVSAARQSVFSTIDPKFNALQTQLDETSLLVGAVQGKIAGLSQKLGTVEGALDTQNETTASVQLVTKSLALENLKKVSQNGGAFGAALTSLERAGIEAEAIAALQPFSVSGLKDTASLKSELDNLISLAAAKNSPTGEAPKELSAFEKLVKNAKGFVKIRSLSDEGSSPFNQLQAQFDGGNLDGFLETLETLSDDQKQVFNQWLVDWKGNLALSSLIQKIEQDVAADPADEASSQ